jgi:hypothetical protein
MNQSSYRSTLYSQDTESHYHKRMCSSPVFTDLNQRKNNAGEFLNVIQILIPNSLNVVTPSLKFEELYIYIYICNIYTVTDLINVLPGNSSVNTVQHATIVEAVFPVSAVTSRNSEWWSRDIYFLWCVSVPWLYKWQNSFGSRTSQFSVGDSHRKFVVEEEYRKSVCEDLTCDLKTLCVP